MSETIKIEIDARWEFEQGTTRLLIGKECFGYYFPRDSKYEAWKFYTNIPLGLFDSNAEARQAILDALNARIIDPATAGEG